VVASAEIFVDNIGQYLDSISQGATPGGPRNESRYPPSAGGCSQPRRLALHWYAPSVEPAMVRFGIYAVLAVLVVTLGMIFGGQL
jgi:hypothetical protein